ncbi:hypothetical protein EVAR_75001_1 [Eumeta japonica]|uniref:Mariner Mos1 transposase n=1 Tax=Eumeta variegata TaxID=151549 RepID=A0A4C1VAG8_EUMVA|nr:hypothetical protein EVAR_75001_1 [Eumeta japonica]
MGLERHYELLPPGKTINSNLYQQQLMILDKYGQGFGWKVLMHPPYSPNLAPFRFTPVSVLQNSLEFKRGRINLSEEFSDSSGSTMNSHPTSALNSNLSTVIRPILSRYRYPSIFKKWDRNQL